VALAAALVAGTWVIAGSGGSPSLTSASVRSGGAAVHTSQFPHQVPLERVAHRDGKSAATDATAAKLPVKLPGGSTTAMERRGVSQPTGAANPPGLTQAPPASVSSTPQTPPPAPPANQVPAAPASSTPVPATPVPATPANPPANIAPNPNFLDICSGTMVDTSTTCTQAALAAIDAARADEGIGPMVLPGDWPSLTPGEQLFVVTNLERTARGLAPLSAMDVALDGAAAAGAADGSDPTPPAGYPYTIWASNWGGALGNPLEVDYLWMYDDGPGSANVDCPTAGAAGCWGHRDNVLVSLPCQACVMGAAVDPTGWEGYPAWAEILVETQGPIQASFTWSDVTPYLPSDEQ